ncbi:MAG: alpha/beta fold hydrolase [Prevotella sp.]|nr:alpha/beta fold hydrolase [Prevotella sp.]
MKQKILALVLFASSLFSLAAQPVTTKTIDNGGSGLFKAIAVKEATMPDFVVYRPKDLLHAHARCGALPILLFGNGGCADTSVGYERMLNEVASHGYIVVAIGEMQGRIDDWPTGQTESSELMRGLELMLQLNRMKGTEYYHFIDTTRIAAAGHSCGGAQVLCNAGDPRLKTYPILNAGMGDMELARAFRRKGIPFSMFVDDGEHNGKWVQPALEDAIKRADKNFETLWIKNGSRHIYGIISKPQYTGRKQPVAIIAHGFNGTHAYGRTYFKTLNDLGYQCYAFDFPCGSVKSRSDSNTMNMSVLDEQSDMEAIVRHFRQQPDVDAGKIVLIGESQGGFVSAMTAAHIPQDIDKLVLVFPALCIPENWNTRYPEVTDIPDTTRLWKVPLGRRFFMELRDIDVFKTIRKFRKPVLIVQGDADTVVSMEDSRRAAKLYNNARLYVIPAAGHGFKPKEQQLSLEQIRTFLK